MKIKDVTLRDLDKIFNIESKVFGEDSFSKEVVKKLIRKNTFFLKLIKKNILKRDIIGFIIVVKDRADRVNIINILIKPRYQNQGYGTFLLRNTIEKTKKLNEIKKIVLNVSVRNIIAIKMYEKFQLRIVQKIEKYYRPDDSAYFMELNINVNNS